MGNQTSNCQPSCANVGCFFLAARPEKQHKREMQRITPYLLNLIIMGTFSGLLATPELVRPAPEIDEPGLRAPVLLNPEVISFPTYLTHLEGITEGKATVRFEVDAQGRLMDIICLEASHEAFALAALNGLSMALFEAGQIDGKPAAMAPTLYIRFSSGSAVISRTMDDQVASQIGSSSPHSTAFALTPASQLDAPLKIRFQPRPFVAEDDNGHRIAGEAVVTYYVDRDGRVRLPMIRESSHPLVGHAAIETIRGLIFEVPLSNGKPVPVRVVQPYKAR